MLIIGHLYPSMTENVKSSHVLEEILNYKLGNLSLHLPDPCYELAKQMLVL